MFKSISTNIQVLKVLSSGYAEEVTIVDRLKLLNALAGHVLFR